MYSIATFLMITHLYKVEHKSSSSKPSNHTAHGHALNSNGHQTPSSLLNWPCSLETISCPWSVLGWVRCSDQRPRQSHRWLPPSTTPGIKSSLDGTHQCLELWTILECYSNRASTLIRVRTMDGPTNIQVYCNLHYQKSISTFSIVMEVRAQPPLKMTEPMTILAWRWNCSEELSSPSSPLDRWHWWGIQRKASQGPGSFPMCSGQ